MKYYFYRYYKYTGRLSLTEDDIVLRDGTDIYLRTRYTPLYAILDISELKGYHKYNDDDVMIQFYKGIELMAFLPLEVGIKLYAVVEQMKRNIVSYKLPIYLGQCHVIEWNELMLHDFSFKLPLYRDNFYLIERDDAYYGINNDYMKLIKQELLVFCKDTRYSFRPREMAEYVISEITK